MIIYLLLLLIICTMYCHKITNESEQYSLETVNFLKGIMASLVVMNHVFKEGFLLGNIAVSLFLCFSGYAIKLKKCNAKNTIKKCVSIYLPFSIINIMNIMYNVLILKNSYSINEILLSFVDCRFVTYGWYIIIIIIIFYVLSYLVYTKLNISNKYQDYLIYLATIFMILGLYAFGFKSWWYVSLLGFPCGVLIYNLKNSKFHVNFLFPFLLLIVISSLCVYKNLREGLLFCIIQYTNSILICFTYYCFARKYYLKNKFVEFFGKYSLYIYLLHPVFFKLINLNCYHVEIFLVVAFSLILGIMMEKVRKKILRY